MASALHLTRRLSMGLRLPDTASPGTESQALYASGVYQEGTEWPSPAATRHLPGGGGEEWPSPASTTHPLLLPDAPASARLDKCWDMRDMRELRRLSLVRSCVRQAQGRGREGRWEGAGRGDGLGEPRHAGAETAVLVTLLHATSAFRVPAAKPCQSSAV
eukprot:320909-Chlamydomonas_euryale.AAC.4